MRQPPPGQTMTPTPLALAGSGVKTVRVGCETLRSMVAPAATPKAVIDSLNKQVVAAIHAPEVNKKLVEFGVEPVGSTPEQFAQLLQSETVRWHKLIRELGITLD